MDQETLRILISTSGAVAGALLVAVAAVLAPLLTQNHRYRRDRELAAAERLRDAIVEFVDWSMREVHFDEAWGIPETEVRHRRERAFVALDTLLAGNMQPVSDWLHGFAGDRGLQDHPRAEIYFVHHGIRELVAWQQGGRSVGDLHPFRYVTNGTGGWIEERLDAWQQT